jgi:uncharacterized repeat protein (TIGR01451 family)
MQRSRTKAHRSPTGSKIPALCIPLGLLLCLLGALCPVATVDAQSGFTFPLTETFKGSTAPGWQLGGSAVLTNEKNGTDGWLRLTPNSTYQAGYAYYNTPIATGRGLVVTFDYGAWGGNGADGLTFFLFDGATTAFNVGASGGSLGYAQKTGVKGLSNGYLGLGLDEFGNYSNPNEGRSGGPGATPHAVAIRGPGNGTTGYAYLAGTTRLDRAPWNLPRLDCPNNGVNCLSSTVRPAPTAYFRQVRITVTPIGAAYQVAVAMRFNYSSTTWTPLLGPFTMPTSAPSTLKMGFAASTGGNYNYHEIRNLVVTQQVPDLTGSKSVQNASTGGGSVEPGNELLYSVVLNNNTAAAVSGVHFSDPIPANTTYVASSAVAPGGATLQGTNPISITGITVPAYGQATITFKVQVNTPIPADVTQISNQGTYTYGATTAQTDGDAVTAGNQATVIGVTAGPNFDTSTKSVTVLTDLAPIGDVSPGDTLLYHVVLPNSGNQNSPTTSFVDLLPGNTTYVSNSATASGGTVSYNNTSKTLNWTVSVNAGSQATLDFRVTVNTGVKIRDVISNQGTVTYGTTSVLTDADLATPGKQPTELLVGGRAILAATKSAAVVGGGALQPGGLLRYTIRLANTGSYSVTGATFADTIPANTTFVAATTDIGAATYSAPALSVTGINLTSGVTATIQLTVQLDSPLTGVTQISNQGVANYDSNQGGANNTALPTDGDPATAGQQPTYSAIPNIDLAVTKTVANSNPAEAGTIVYTVVVTNVGASSAADVTVADPVPAGLTYAASSATAGSYTSPMWSVGALASGASASLTLSATVNLGQGGATITNTASVTATLYDASPANNAASASLVVQATTLSGAVTDIETGSPLVGVAVAVTDSLGHPCTATTSADGRYAVTSGVSGCLLAPGAATVAATGNAPAGYLLRSASATIMAGAANSGNLTLVRPSLRGAVIDLGSGVALVGATVTITQGANVCTTTTETGGAYSFVAGAACGLTSGPATVAAATTGYQTTTATPTLLDSGSTTQNLALATSDLLITMSDGQTTAQPGAVLDYLLTVVNQGNITATSVIITDTLPTYLAYVDDDASVAPTTNPEADIYAWALGDLAPSATLSFTLRAQVAISLPDGATNLANYANLTTASPDRDRTNNEVSDVDTVVAHPDLTLFKSATADSSPIAAGGAITYTYIGDNRGSAIATGVRITDTLDENTTYVDGSAVLVVGEDTWPLTAVYNDSLHQLLLELPTMPPGAEGYLRYKAIVDDPLPSGVTLITNTATVTSNEPDLDPLDNRSTVVLGAQPGADIFVQKVALPDSIPALPGGQMLYRLRYGNLSMGTATAAFLTDAIPANTSYVAGTLFLDGLNLTDAAGDDGGQYLSDSHMISVTLGDLAGGAIGMITFTVRIDNVLPAGVANISNTAFITATVNDPIASDNQATAVMEVAAQPDLTLVKTDGRTQVLAGDLLTYTLTFSNTGNQAATGVKITDTLLACLEYVSASPGATQSGAYTVTWNIGDLPVNAARTLTLTVRVRSDVQPAAVVANRATIADDGANGIDINPAGNTFTDSDLVIAPYIKLEKRASGPTYVGQPVTYTIEGYNSHYATAYGIVVTDTLPANTTLVPGSITGGGSESGGVITWNMGDVEPGRTGTLSFTVIPNASAGGATQTVATLSTEAISGSLVLTSSATLPPTGSRPWCDFDACAAFKGIYQGEDGLPPTGWNDNPRLTRFDDATWTPAVASNTAEFIYWADPANLAAEWVTIHPISETIGNFTFFRQPFCLPLNAIGLSASIQAAGDDVSDIYLNGVYLGQEVGAGAADAFDATSGIQSGINYLSVQLLNNRHGGHAAFDGRDHSGLIFNLDATFTGLRPFAAAPAVVLAGQTATIAVDELALGGRKPYSYTLDYGDGSAAAPYQLGTGFSHLYSAAGVYTATLTARAQYGCTGSDQMVITVLPATANLLANPVVATYRDANGQAFAAVSGAGAELLPAADLSITKTLSSATRTPGLAVSYRITVTNHGPNDVTGATVLDSLPAAMTGVSWTCGAATGGGACGAASGVGHINTTAHLPDGATVTFSVTGTIAAGASGLLENTATVATPADVTDLVMGNNASIDSGPLTPQIILAVSQSSSPKPGLAPSRAVRYTIRVENSGVSDATGVSIADLFPATVTGVTWTCTAASGSTCTASGSGAIDDAATLLAGGVLTYTAVGIVDPAATAGTVVANTMTATYGGSPASATDNNTLVALTSLTATKDALRNTGDSSRSLPFSDVDGNGGISPGDILKYRVDITNGANTAYQVLFNDNLGAHTTLVVGSVTCDQACTVTQGNNDSDSAVSVSMDTIAANSAATLYYRVTVNNPLTFQLAAIGNQGYAASANAASIATDDATTPEASDATVVALTMGSIRGVAWMDDGDGSKAAGEAGIPGLAVTLYYTDSTALVQVASTNTDGAGAYTFTVLADGEYQIDFSLAEYFTYGAVWGADRDNKVDPAIGGTAVIMLGANEQRTNISTGQTSLVEFGYLPASFANTTLADDGARHILPAASADRLYLGTGVVTALDGVESTTASGPGDGVLRPLDAAAAWQPGATGTLTVTTSGNGRLWGWFDWNGDGHFGDDEAHDLGAVVTSTQSITLAVSTGYTAANPLFARFRLYPADFTQAFSDTGAVYNGEVEDYGWYAIQGVVFDDDDGDGVQDPGDTGHAGLTVTLQDANDVSLATVQTAAAGAYAVTGVTAGTYTVVFTLPSGYAAITPLAVDVTVDGTPILANFAMQQVVGAITGAVFNDTNHNGGYNDGENGIAGVLLTLSNGETTTTAANGAYTFTVLPGTYTITATNRAGYVSTGDVSGANDDMITGATVTAGQVTGGQYFFDTLPADLSLTKSASNLAPRVGDVITFVVVMNNAGPNTATNVGVSEVLPSGYTYVASSATAGSYNGASLWTVGSVTAGGVATLTMTATVNATGVHVNYVEVAASDPLDLDSTPGNSSQTEDDNASVTAAPVGTPTLSVVTTTLDLPSWANSFTVPIVFNNDGLAISSVTFALDYDETCVRIAAPNTDIGAPPAGYALLKTDNAETGVVQIAVWDPDAPLAAMPNGVILQIRFTLLGSCQTTDQATDFTFVSPTATFGNTEGAGVAGAAIGGRYALDLNQAPTAIAFAGTVNENTSGSRAVGTLSATDPDGDGATTTFALSGACAGSFNNDGFTVNPSSPTQLVTDRIFNYEAGAAYPLCIEANDGQGAFLAQTITITVTDMNDAPSAISLSNAEIVEGAPLGTLIDAFSTTDEDEDDTHTYTFTTGAGDTDNALFTLTADGQLSTNTTLVYASRSQYKIRVQSQDRGSAAVAQQFTIVVFGRPMLTLPGEPSVAVVTAGEYVTAPVGFRPAGNNIVAASFVVTYNTTCLDYVGLTGLQPAFADAAADADDDGAVTVNLSSSAAPLVEGVAAALVFKGQANCAPASSWTGLAFSSDPVLTIAGNVARPTTTSDGILVVVEADARGDCNSDDAVNAGDFAATAIEIFDIESTNSDSQHVHKDSWLYSPRGAFAGSAQGCDANDDRIVDVTDIVCTARRFFGLTCNTTAARAAVAAVVAAPGAILVSPGAAVDVPIQLTANGNAIVALAFTLTFDPQQLAFDPADSDGDGLPDAVSFNAPADLYRMVVYDAELGRIQVLLTGIAVPLPLLSDGIIATVQLTGRAEANAQPAGLTLSNVSAGSEEGQTVPIEVGATGVWLPNRVFMPLVASQP